MDGSLRERNFHPLFLKAFKYAMAKLVLHSVLIHELAHLADQGKIQRGLAKTGNETHDRARFCQKALGIDTGSFITRFKRIRQGEVEQGRRKA